jgi:dihydrolipoamide dehydrogenase
MRPIGRKQEEVAMEPYDTIVVGGGPGGYTAAIRLAQLGKRTLVVEREALGGVCLNWGCIPSKALITAAATVDHIRHAGTMGIGAGEPSIDFAATQRWKDGIVKRLTGGIGTLVRANGSTSVAGEARLLDARTVQVTAADGTVSRYQAAEAIVLATGARVMSIPGFEPDGARVITAKEAVSLESIPRSLVVVGGGVIGMELGMMYQKLGTRVTVVEMTEGILPGVDPDLSAVVARRFRKRGGVLLAPARATGWEPAGDGVRVTVEHGGATQTVEADHVLVSVGFRPNTAGLGLEQAGVRVDVRGHIATDRSTRTNVPGVYAVGDVTGGPYLAHKAFREGEVAAEVIHGRNIGRDWLAMPSAIFTDPEISTVGLTEAEARAAGHDVRVGRFPFSALGRAMSLGDTDGFVKIVTDRDRVLGVHIVGPEASELIAEAALAIEMQAAPEDLALTIHPHPTLSEGVLEAFKHSLGEAVHVMNGSAKSLVPSAK